MGAAVAWFDSTSRDPSRLAGFYRELFGWTVAESPDPGYSHLDTAESLGGKTIVPPTGLPGEFGKFATFADPDGHTLGMWS
jgi:hypothetical protein